MMKICLFSLWRFTQDSAGQLQTHVQVGEVLGGFVQLWDRDLQLDLVVVNRHLFGHRQREGHFGNFIRAGIEADEVD